MLKCLCFTYIGINGIKKKNLVWCGYQKLLISCLFCDYSYKVNIILSVIRNLFESSQYLDKGIMKRIWLNYYFYMSNITQWMSGFLIRIKIQDLYDINDIFCPISCFFSYLKVEVSFCKYFKTKCKISHNINNLKLIAQLCE